MRRFEDAVHTAEEGRGLRVGLAGIDEWTAEHASQTTATGQAKAEQTPWLASFAS